MTHNAHNAAYKGHRIVFRVKMLRSMTNSSGMFNKYLPMKRN